MTPDLQEVSEETQNPEKWVREYGDALFRYAFSVLKDRERSEDAVQETFLAALGTKAGFEHRSSVKSWLFGILKHKIVDLIRTESRYVRPGDFEKDSDDPEALDQFFNANGRWCTPPRSWEHPGASLENKEFWKELDHCLALLPAKTHQIFFLREMDGMSTEEICQELDVTPTNVWKALSRARLLLRDCLERFGFGHGRGHSGSVQEAGS